MAKETNDIVEPTSEPSKALDTKRVALREMILQLHQETRLEDTETLPTEEFVADLLESILAAETEDEIFEVAEAGTVSGQDFTARPFQLLSTDLTFAESAERYRSQPGGFPYFARLKVREIATGEEHHVTCGGKTVVTTLYALRQRGFLAQWDDKGGRPLVLVGIPTNSGNEALILQPYNMPAGRGGKK